MFLYNKLLFLFSIPIWVMGINGGYLLAIFRVYFLIRIQNHKNKVSRFEKKNFASGLNVFFSHLGLKTKIKRELIYFSDSVSTIFDIKFLIAAQRYSWGYYWHSLGFSFLRQDFCFDHMMSRLLFVHSFMHFQVS